MSNNGNMDERYDERYIEIGLKIAFFRKKKQMTQAELAEKIGKSSGYISQVETPGKFQPISFQMLFDVADALEVEPYKFLLFD